MLDINFIQTSQFIFETLVLIVIMLNINEGYSILKTTLKEVLIVTILDVGYFETKKQFIVA